MTTAIQAQDHQPISTTARVRCSVSDLFKLTERSITPQGFLVAPGKLARTGIQEYSAGELGLDKTKGMDRHQTVRLYRPHEEVFAAEALASFEGLPITINHPSVDVDAANWRDLAVGDAHGISASDPYVAGKLIVRDKAAIASVQGGKAEISMGYSFELDSTAGVLPDGEAYDGVMRKILGNHVAIVDFGRAGPACRIADSKDNKEKPMARKVIVDGIGIDLEETPAAIVEKTLAAKDAALKSATDERGKLEERATKAEAALTVANDTAAKLVADHAAETAKLTAQILTADAVEALVEERTKLVADASALVEGIETKGKSVAAIRAEALIAVIATDEAVKAVVNAALDGVALDKADPNDVRKVFNVVVASRAKGEDGSTATAVDSSVNDAQSRALLGASNGSRTGSTKLSGRDLMMYRSRNGGRDPGQTNA